MISESLSVNHQPKSKVRNTRLRDQISNRVFPRLLTKFL